MQDTCRDEVPVAFTIGSCFSIDSQFDGTLQDKTNLGRMRMLRQIHVLAELHENDLMGIGPGKIGLDSRQRDIGFRQIGDRRWK